VIEEARRAVRDGALPAGYRLTAVATIPQKTLPLETASSSGFVESPLPDSTGDRFLTMAVGRFTRPRTASQSAWIRA
jgi:hypothetical protein